MITMNSQVIISDPTHLNIDSESSKYLLNGGNNGYDRIQVEVHNGVFHKMSNFHHNMSIFHIVHQGQIGMLVQEKEFPALVKGYDYHNLILDHCKLVDTAMLLVFGKKEDRYFDHNNTKFQHMCAYIVSAFLLRTNRCFIYSG